MPLRHNERNEKQKVRVYASANLSDSSQIYRNELLTLGLVIELHSLAPFLFSGQLNQDGNC